MEGECWFGQGSACNLSPVVPTSACLPTACLSRCSLNHGLQLPTPCFYSTKTRKERAGDPAFSTVRQPVGWHWPGLNACIQARPFQSWPGLSQKASLLSALPLPTTAALQPRSWSRWRAATGGACTCGWRAAWTTSWPAGGDCYKLVCC